MNKRIIHIMIQFRLKERVGKNQIVNILINNNTTTTKIINIDEHYECISISLDETVQYRVIDISFFKKKKEIPKQNIVISLYMYTCNVVNNIYRYNILRGR